MDRETRLKITIRYAAIAGALGVATFVSAPLFAQARAVIEASATVINPAAQLVMTETASIISSRSVPTDKSGVRQLRGGLAQIRVARHALAKEKELQPTVVTLEYAAN